MTVPRFRENIPIFLKEEKIVYLHFIWKCFLEVDSTKERKKEEICGIGAGLEEEKNDRNNEER